MTGNGFAWVTCNPSLERRRWLRLATAGCGAIAVALAVAAVADPSAARVAGLALAIGGALLALGRERAADQPGELRLDVDGTFWWRQAGESESERLTAAGLSYWLAVFVGPGGRRCVWRDSLPPAHWRILRACVRWHVDRDRAGSAATGRAPDQFPNR